MKRNVFLFLSFWVSISAMAQSDYRKHQIEGGVGIWNTNEVINSFSDMIISSVNMGDTKMKDDMSYASWHLAYRYYASKKLGLGLFMAYDHATSDAVRTDAVIGKFYKRHLTAALEAEFGYLRTDFISLYGLAGVGGTRYGLEFKPSDGTTDSEAEYFVNYQFTPLGIRLGSTFGFYAEIGFGYRGVINAGLFAQF